MDDAFTWRDGVNVCRTALWCDARRAQDLCFLSNARLDLRGPHRQVLCTRRTHLLLSATGKGGTGETLLTPFGRPFSLGSARLELFPSGYLPGAASLLIMLDRDRRRVVYAGHINPQGGVTCEQMQVRAAEALVCEAPLLPIGLPLPSYAEAAATLLQLADEVKSDGAVPIFLSPALGTAQELVALLCHHGTLVHAHPRIYSYLRVYQEMGIRLSPPDNPPRCFVSRRPARAGEVILWPIDSRLGDPKRLLSGAGSRAYLCTGAALSKELVSAYHHELHKDSEGGLSGALPFPDSVDLPALLRYVSDCEARDLYLTAGYDEKVVRAFAERRVRVHPLGPPRQLALFSA